MFSVPVKNFEFSASGSEGPARGTAAAVALREFALRAEGNSQLAAKAVARLTLRSDRERVRWAELD
jgi:hypothetical protein